MLFTLPAVKPVDSTGTPYAGAKLYFYAAGTSTPVTTYADSDLGTPSTTVSGAIVANAGGAFAPIYLDPALTYRVVLKTSAGVTLGDWDDYDQVALSAALVGAVLWATTAAETLASITPTYKQYPPGDVRRYGADPTGVSESYSAWNKAIQQAMQAGGSEVTGPGTYLIGTGLKVTTDYVTIRGTGDTVLKANANTIDVLKICASRCFVSNLKIDGNGKTAIGGLVLAPSDEADTATVSQINYSEFSNVEVYNCAEGLRMRAGPSSGADSGVFCNQFFGLMLRDCIRAIYMQDSVNSGGGGPNRNNFYGTRVWSTNTVANTGVQIKTGTTNNFFGLALEGIANGTSPNATPTAVKIAATGSNGYDNNDNQFYGAHLESCTRDLDNANTYLAIFGGTWDATKFGGGGVKPRWMIGGGPSVMPVVTTEYERGEGVSGFASGYTKLTSNPAVISYTLSQLAALAKPAGLLVFVTDETSGATLAYSDGTNFRRVADRAVCS